MLRMMPESAVLHLVDSWEYRDCRNVFVELTFCLYNRCGRMVEYKSLQLYPPRRGRLHLFYFMYFNPATGCHSISGDGVA